MKRLSNHFGEIYELLTYDVPDELWIDVIHHYTGDAASVLDAGCGTGRILKQLNIKEKYGFDISQDMIAYAQRQIAREDMHLSVQNMLSFKYERTFDAIIATNDVINYLKNKSEVSQVLENVSHHLNPGGVFIFDIHSEYKMRTEFNDQTYADDLDDASYIWFAHRGYAELSVVHEMIIFTRQEDDTYLKTSEKIYQRTYPYETMINLIEDSSLEHLHSFSDFDVENTVTDICERVFFILKKPL